MIESREALIEVTSDRVSLQICNRDGSIFWQYDEETKYSSSSELVEGFTSIALNHGVHPDKLKFKEV